MRKNKYTAGSVLWGIVAGGYASILLMFALAPVLNHLLTNNAIEILFSRIFTTALILGVIWLLSDSKEETPKPQGLIGESKNLALWVIKHAAAKQYEQEDHEQANSDQKPESLIEAIKKIIVWLLLAAIWLVLMIPVLMLYCPMKGN